MGMNLLAIMGLTGYALPSILVGGAMFRSSLFPVCHGNFPCTPTLLVVMRFHKAASLPACNPVSTGLYTADDSSDREAYYQRIEHHCFILNQKVI